MRDKMSSPIKNKPTPSTTSAAVSDSAARHASSGSGDSGTWSSPSAWLLGGKSKRRFTKLEHRSSTMAAAAAIAPMLKSRLSSGALAVVTETDNMIPRMVFDGPNRGLPWKSVRPASNGRAKDCPKIFLATTGVPLASVNKTIACTIGKRCIWNSLRQSVAARTVLAHVLDPARPFLVVGKAEPIKALADWFDPREAQHA